MPAGLGSVGMWGPDPGSKGTEPVNIWMSSGKLSGLQWLLRLL
jgi:hypothetical protein